MKKLLFIIILGLTSFQAQSQVLITLLLGDKLNSDGLEFGLEGGINWTKISGMETADYGRRWNLGFYFDIRLNKQWFIYTGTLVKANLGVENLTDGDLSFLKATIYSEYDNDTTRLAGGYHQKLSYFLVPLLFKYKFKNHLYADLGFQFGLMYNAWVEFNSEYEGIDATLKEYNEEMINTIDAGFMAGMGYTMFKGSGWTIGAKYYYGFVDVYKNKPGTRNSSFFVHLNIPIGTGGGKGKKTDQSE